MRLCPARASPHVQSLFNSCMLSVAQCCKPPAHCVMHQSVVILCCSRKAEAAAGFTTGMS